MKKYRFMSNITGEIVEGLVDVIKVIAQDVWKCGILNWNWKYKREGF